MTYDGEIAGRRVAHHDMSGGGTPLILLDFGADMGWQDRALCAETDPESFFPEKGGSTREAKRVCLGCDVRAECLEYALDHEERFGIWGGFSERERRKLNRERQRRHLSVVSDDAAAS